jgi:ribonuclease P protein component
MRVVSLKRREDFLRLRGGVRWSTGAFVIETKRRGEHPEAEVARAAAGPRFGLTVTKKLGGAVVRNRIRRRLKEALRGLEPDLALPEHDYVLIARAAASTWAFERLRQDLVRGLSHVNQMAQRAGGPAPDRNRVERTGERDGSDKGSARAHEKT